jgi:hypothetical protein
MLAFPLILVMVNVFSVVPSTASDSNGILTTALAANGMERVLIVFSLDTLPLVVMVYEMLVMASDPPLVIVTDLVAGTGTWV